MSRVEASSLQAGAMTPALRDLCIELMEKMIKRRDSSIISDPYHDYENSFEFIRNSLIRSKYISFLGWKQAVLGIILPHIKSEILSKSIAAEELRQYFLKRVEVLEELSLFHIRSVVEQELLSVDNFLTISPAERFSRNHKLLFSNSAANMQSPKETKALIPPNVIFP